MLNLVQAAKEQVSTLTQAACEKAAVAGILPGGFTVNGTVDIPKDTSHGDYATSFALAASKFMKLSPRVIAQAVLDHLVLEGTYFDAVEIAGPGFLNFYLGAHWYGEVLSCVESEGETYGAIDEGRGQKLMVEFVSANPTGTMTPETLLIDLLEATDALVLVDEAYFEFSRQTMRPHMSRHPNLAILRTFSKAFSLAGLRAGYLLADASVVRELTKVRQPYSVNRFTQVAAELTFRDRMVFEAGVREAMRNRDRLVHGLSQMAEVAVFPSEANYILFRIDQAAAVWRDLLHDHSILVRDFSRTPGLEDCLRVTVGSEEEIDRFLKAMDEIIARKHASAHFGINATANRHLERNGE